MPSPRTSDHLAQILRELPEPLLNAFGELPLSMWIVDRLGHIRWLNLTASGGFEARVGAHFLRFVEEDGVADVRERFARKIHGHSGATINRVSLKGAAGPVTAEVATVPIRDHDEEVVGVIAVICPSGERAESGRRTRKPRLTPRQHQVLELLAHGRSTAEIAQTLQISDQTVRNHIRHLLAELSVRTRLEAVVAAYRNGWL
jgi:DNA-binding CsgD family transcriptional regulator